MVVPINPAAVGAAPTEPEPFDPEPWSELASEFIEGKGELTPKWLGSAATLLATTLVGPWAGAITGTLATALAVKLGTTGTARLEAAEKEHAQRATLQQDVTRAVAEAFKAEVRRLALAQGEREAGKAALAQAMVQGLVWLEERGQLQAIELHTAIATRTDALSEQSSSEFIETLKYALKQHEQTRRVVSKGFASQNQQHELTRQQLSDASARQDQHHETTQRSLDTLAEGFARVERLLTVVLHSLGESRPGAARAVLRRRLPDRDPRFVGRETELDELHQCLTQSLAVGVTQKLATWGHGGLGKSSLAIEYAWRHTHSYPGGVLFLRAEHNVTASLAEWAPLLGITGSTTRTIATGATSQRAAGSAMTLASWRTPYAQH